MDFAIALASVLLLPFESDLYFAIRPSLPDLLLALMASATASSSTAMAAPMMTGAVGMGALFGAGAALLNL